MTAKVAAALAAAAARIGGDTPRLDAELLLAHAARATRDDLLLGRVAVVPHDFPSLVARRAAGEPIAYLVGRRDFWDMTLAVTPATLIPRPDSETLVEAAIAHFAATPGPSRVLDLGTGSGALLLAALRVWPAATGIGVDRSAGALAVATANAAAVGVAARARFVEGGWDAAPGRHDLILCNPPYIAIDEPLPRDVRYEPATALFAGADGLDDYRAIVPLLRMLLMPGGVACLEIGASQAAAVIALAGERGLDAAVVRDLGGRDRCLVVTP